MKNKSILLLAAAGLVLTGCGENPTPNPSDSISNGAESSSMQGESTTSNQTSDQSESQGASSSSALPTTSIDYTEGWSDAMILTLKNNLGGQLIPFIDFPGEIRAVWVDKVSSSSYDYSLHSYVYENTPAHLYVFSSGAFDNNLLYNVKVTYERAGWQVTYTRGATELSARNDADGISLRFYKEKSPTSNLETPALDIFYTEPFRVPEKGAWQDKTMTALSSIGIANGHMLPYTYLGKYAETAVTSAGMVTISGGDWTTYERQIVNAARNSMPQDKKWSEKDGTRITSGYKYNTYTFTKAFSDGYKLTAVLTGKPNLSGSYYSQTLDSVTAILEVTCTHS